MPSSSSSAETLDSSAARLEPALPGSKTSLRGPWSGRESGLGFGKEAAGLAEEVLRRVAEWAPEVWGWGLEGFPKESGN